MRLRYGTLTPQPLAAQYTDPRLILFNAVTDIELPDRIPPLQLLEFYSSKLTAYPAIQPFEEPVTAGITIIVYPANQQLIELADLLPESARFVTPGQLPNLILKTADTLR